MEGRIDEWMDGWMTDRGEGVRDKWRYYGWMGRGMEGDMGGKDCLLREEERRDGGRADCCTTPLY